MFKYLVLYEAREDIVHDFGSSIKIIEQDRTKFTMFVLVPE